MSEFIKNNLPKELENEFNILITNERKRLSILKGMLKRNDENNSEKTENSNIENNIDFEKMNELLKKVYISTNLKLLAENMKLNLKTSGSTCISVLFKKSIKKAYISNVGDSRVEIINHQKKTRKKELLNMEEKYKKLKKRMGHMKDLLEYLKKMKKVLD